MLDIHFIRANRDQVKAAVRNKKLIHRVDVDQLLALDVQLSTQRKDCEVLLADKNRIDAAMQRAQSTAEKDQLIKKGKEIKALIKVAEQKSEGVQKEFTEMMLQLPNVTSELMPIGKDESENSVLRTWGEPKKFNFVPRDHVDLGKALDIIDCEASGQIAGSRFFYLKGDAVLLQFALAQFVFRALTDTAVVKECAQKVGNPFTTAFVPMLPPVMMKPEIMQKMDRLDPVDERYIFADDNLVLIGSAEQTMGPYHMNKLWLEEDLPIRYVGYSSAFRRESGSHGKDVRGILRVHQFDKMEMETFVPAEYGQVEQDLLVALQEYLLQQLELPYRVMQICTGDTGKPDFNQYDLECWIPTQQRYRETHTSDYMTDFQARRLNIRYKDQQGTNRYVHMNDATAIAMPRAIIAILENYQQADGSVVVPTVLRPYVGKEIITPS